MLLFTCETFTPKFYIKGVSQMTTKKNTKASAKRNTKREKPNPSYRAVLSIYGEVISFYEGDKAVYITIKVWNDSEYYSLINVSVDYDIAEGISITEGETIGLKTVCSSFFDKKSNRTIPIFTAFDICNYNEVVD